MNQILKALLSFIGITCFAFGLEAQTYSAVTNGSVCPTLGVACPNASFQGGICLSLDYLNNDNPTYSARLKMTLAGGGNFPSNGIMSVYEGGICGYSIAYVSYTSSQSSRTITVPLTFPVGTTKSYYITMTPNTTIPPNIVKRWAGPFQIKAVACTTNVPLLNSPANGTVFASNIVAALPSWGANGNNYTVTYRVTVKDLTTNTTLVNNQATQATNLQVNGLIAGHSYSWFVKAEKYGCTTTTSATRTFSIASNAQPTTCGTVKIFLPRQGSNNNARSTLLSWEHELNRGVNSYTLQFTKVSNNQTVTINGNTLNTITVPTSVPATLTFSVANSADLEYNTEYRITIRGYNMNNQEIVNNIANNFRYTTMPTPNIQQTPNGCTTLVPYGTALGHLENVVAYKNGHFTGTNCNRDELGLNYQVPVNLAPNFTILNVEGPNSMTISNVWGYQCQEFIRRYAAVRYGINLDSRNAIDYFSNANDGFLKAYPNNNVIPPRVGDILCIGAHTATNGGYGHVGIVKEVTASKVYITNQNLGLANNTQQGIIDLHMSASYDIVSTNGIFTMSKSHTNSQGVVTWIPIQGWLRAEPKLTVELGTTKAESGNNTFVVFNAQPSFKIEQHAGAPVFKLGIAQYNTATNCYDIEIANLVDIANTGTAISNIPTLAIGKYKARVTTCYGDCSNYGVTNRPVYFERVTPFAGEGEDRASIEVQDITNLPTIQMSLIPNPAQESVNVFVNSANEEKASIVLFDATGRQVERKEVELLQGEQQFVVQTNALANGIYHCRLQTTKGETINKKLTIVH